MSVLGEASVANLMKSALEPNESEANNSALMPFDGNNGRSHTLIVDSAQITRSLNCGMDI